MKSQYSIIISTIAFLVLSMLFLAYIEQHQRNLQENFWSIYFVAPLDTTNAFVIDNRTPEDATFTYEIHAKYGTLLHSDTVTLTPKNRTLIETSPKQDVTPISIIVYKDGEKKEIYKN